MGKQRKVSVLTNVVGWLKGIGGSIVTVGDKVLVDQTIHMNIRIKIEPKRFKKITDTSMVISKTNGIRTIAKATNIFHSIDEHFNKSDKKSHATVDTSVEVYEMMESSTYFEMFSTISRGSFRSMVFTQDQIIVFVETFPALFQKKEYVTFFLYEYGNEFLIAGVRVRSNKIYIEQCWLTFSYVGYCGDICRVVAPQLI